MVSPALTFALILIGIFALIIVWSRIRQDVVGKRKRVKKTQAGLQGRVDEWLYWSAPLGAPRARKVITQEPQPGDPPWSRALQTVVRHEAALTGQPMENAYEQLLGRARNGLVRAFLRGRVHRAIQEYGRTRYTGPDPLYFLWLYLVAYPRYGRRQLYLDTLSAALKELRTP